MASVPPFDPASGEPDYLYARMADHLEARIRAGDLAAGARLPGERDLADDLAQIEAFDRLCRQHGVRLRFRWHQEITDTRALFDVAHQVREFTITDEHLRLLRHGHVFWDEAEFGAPSIDPKRPYGNSNVYRDIAEILDVPDSEWTDEEQNRSLDAEWRFLRLHVETAIALQIALVTGEFRTGRYMRDDQWDRRHWRRDQA
jgi:hypothetical protein